MNSTVIDHETQRFGRLLHYAGVAVVLVFGAAGYAWLYTPVESNILDAAMRIDELAQSKQNAEAIRQEHDRLSSRLQDIGARYGALQQRVPETAEAGSFLKFVSEIAHEENLAINNFQPGKTFEGDGYTALEVMLNGKGSFASISSFFDRLSKIQRLSKVKDLSITAERQSDGYPMKATIVIYFGLKGDGKSSDKGASRG
jgi:Tfp pilus assembly protein PilO